MIRLLDFRVLGAAALLFASGALALYGQPDLDQKWAFMAPELEPRLLERQVQIDPAELLQLMNDDYIELIIYDLRDEADWNLFHLVDSERVPLDELAGQRDRLRALPGNGVVVLVSNDEILATRGWQRLMALARPNAYILEGGLNHWLNIYGVAADEAAGHGKTSLTSPDGRLRHPFRRALGDRHAAAKPDQHQLPDRSFTPKVKLLQQVAKAGGCG